MVFSSSLFLFYFLPVFLLLYFVADHKFRNSLLLAGSLVFSFWGSPVFTIIIAGTIIGNFLFAITINKTCRIKRKILFITAMVFNLAFLLIFRYNGFFADIINALLQPEKALETGFLKVLVPLGISFITFQQLSYLIDVYRQETPPLKSLLHYSLLVFYFPKLISGPLVRTNEFSEQIKEHRIQDTLDNKLLGFVRFVIGLSKKVLIANVLGAEVDRIFELPGNELSTPLAWLGILAYTFQIYFDFSGYTDMAIGLARITGFILPENFNSPYISQNITEFWRRWHMTLSAWLRDYLFMPLNVKWRNLGNTGLYLSILITFGLCGMWHNPGWNFILWGLYHGFWLVLDRLFLIRFLKKLGKIPSIIITFFIIVMGWVFFRSPDMQTVGVFFSKLFSFQTKGAALEFKTDFYVMMIVAAVFSFITLFRFGQKLEFAVFEKPYNVPKVVLLGIITVVLFMVSAGSMVSSGVTPFIYFRF